jgi:hypothetical protein
LHRKKYLINQGRQHYGQMGIFHGAFQSQQFRDYEKRELCKSLEIFLIDVPYWWDFKKESLAATIASVRNECLLSYLTKWQQFPDIKMNIYKLDQNLHLNLDGKKQIGLDKHVR